MFKDRAVPGVALAQEALPETESGNLAASRGGLRDSSLAGQAAAHRPWGPWLKALVLAIQMVACLGTGGALGPGALAAGWLARPPTPICRADRVFDGDSLRLICGGVTKEVRLHCIDAPERDQLPWAKQSRRHLREIATGDLELVERDLDRFGRVVGDVYGLSPRRRLLNLAQVEAGQAAVYERYCTDGGFLRAERRARKAGLGIWSRPGEQQTPWTFRLSHPR